MSSIFHRFPAIFVLNPDLFDFRNLKSSKTFKRKITGNSGKWTISSDNCTIRLNGFCFDYSLRSNRNRFSPSKSLDLIIFRMISKIGWKKKRFKNVRRASAIYIRFLQFYCYDIDSPNWNCHRSFFLWLIFLLRTMCFVLILLFVCLYFK